MGKIIRLILDLKNNRVHDFFFLNDGRYSKDADEFVKTYKPSFDELDFNIIKTVFLFNDNITNDELARLINVPYPSIKNRVNGELEWAIVLNKEKYPNTYKISDNFEIVLLSDLHQKKLKNWNKYKKEIIKDAKIEKDFEKSEREKLTNELREYRQKSSKLKTRYKPTQEQIDSLK